MKYVAIGYMTVEWRTFEKTAKYSIENIFDCDIYDGDIIEINECESVCLTVVPQL